MHLTSQFDRRDSKTQIQAPTPKSSSLSLLKLHIQITKLNEEIQDLKATNKELEDEIANKNQEIYEVMKSLCWKSCLIMDTN